MGNVMYFGWKQKRTLVKGPSHLALHLSHGYVTSRRFSAGGATGNAIEVSLFRRTCYAFSKLKK